MSFIDDLRKKGWLKNERIIGAFKAIKREDFVLRGEENAAEIDSPLPIGFGQTISQPLVVAFMLELLDPQPGEKILDIGFGSGWTSALLAYLVGEKGKVVGIEIIPELFEFGKKNIAKYGFIKEGRVIPVCADGSLGYEKEAPFIKILASASAEELPNPWKEQLEIGGKIVAPLKQSIWLFEKEAKNKFKETEHPGFIFVPLTKS